MLTSLRYSLDMIREEVRHMVDKGLINRHQPIYALCGFFPLQEWAYVERELTLNEFLLRDPIGELLGSEIWSDD